MKFNKLITTLFAMCLSYPLSVLAATSKYNMPEGVTPISHDIYQLHMTIFWICVGIGVVVFGVLIYSLIMHRKSRGVVAHQFHANTTIEIIWAVIPFIILIIMAIPATKVLMNMNDDKDAAVTIKVTGYQWKWRYEYLDQGIDFFSNLSTPYDQIYKDHHKDPHYLLEVDNRVVVPAHKKVRLLVTANDVIHSWWVPDLGVKRDGIPGFIHEAWFNIEKPGIYRGQCAELCGVNHAFMPIVVKAVSQEEFDNWVKEKRAAGNSAKAHEIEFGPIQSAIAANDEGDDKHEHDEDKNEQKDIDAHADHEKHTAQTTKQTSYETMTHASAAPAQPVQQPVHSSMLVHPTHQRLAPSTVAAARLPSNKVFTMDEAMQHGKVLYQKYCAACHAEDGTGLSYLFPPLKGSSLSTGYPMNRHIAIILNGRIGSAMQAYADQLSDEEIAAITTYERNAWGNNTGDLVQPAEVAAVRKEDKQ